MKSVGVSHSELVISHQSLVICHQLPILALEYIKGIPFIQGHIHFLKVGALVELKCMAVYTQKAILLVSITCLPLPYYLDWGPIENKYL